MKKTQFRKSYRNQAKEKEIQTKKEIIKKVQKLYELSSDSESEEQCQTKQAESITRIQTNQKITKKKRYTELPKIFLGVDRSILDPDGQFSYQKRFTEQIDLYYENRSEKKRVFYKAYTEIQCKDQIQNSIKNFMQDDGFDLILRPYSEIDFGKKYKYHERKVSFPHFYMRYACSKCTQPPKKTKQIRFKHWTSHKGTVELYYKLVSINVFNKKIQGGQKIDTKKYSTPFVIMFKLRLFRMQCKICYSWGASQLYEPCLQFAIDKFLKKVSDVLNGDDSDSDPHELTDPHMSELCEACSQGKCDRKRRIVSDSENSEE